MTPRISIAKKMNTLHYCKQILFYISIGQVLFKIGQAIFFLGGGGGQLKLK